MTQVDHQTSFELAPLLDALEANSDQTHRNNLLSLCIDLSVNTYIKVPQGDVAVVYRQVAKQQRRSLSDENPSEVAVKKGPTIVNDIKLVALDPADLRQLRDTGISTVNGFLNGGVKSTNSGSYFYPFDYCIIQTDMPKAIGAGSCAWPSKRTLEGLVYPKEMQITLADLFVRTEDVRLLKKAIADSNPVKDKWGHRELAPSVFLVYQACHRPYDFDAIRDWLIANDTRSIFTSPIAATVSRIMKKGVRDGAEEDMDFSKITRNPMRRNYTDDRLSPRMSLVILATDCWIHDQSCSREMEEKLAPVTLQYEQKMKEPGLSLARKTALDTELGAIVRRARDIRHAKLHMPSGLQSFLKDVLHFSTNQSEQLDRVIRETKRRGRHAATEKSAADTVKMLKKHVRKPD